MTYTTSSNAKRISKLERRITKQKPELKYHFTHVSGTVTNLSSEYYNLCNPLQGDGNDQRVGDSIRVQWIDIFLDLEGPDMDCHVIKPIGASDASPGYSSLTGSPGFFRPTQYKTYQRMFTTDNEGYVHKVRVNMGGLKVNFADNSPTTLTTVLYYIRNVGGLTRAVRGTICCCYTDA